MAEEIDYLMSVDMFNNPATVDGERAKALKIVRLILMNPGSDPLHPNMGVGLRQFRYGLNSQGNIGGSSLDELRDKTVEQINTYLPHLRIADVNFTITTDHILSIEIRLDNMLYIYNPDIDIIYPDEIETT